MDILQSLVIHNKKCRCVHCCIYMYVITNGSFYDTVSTHMAITDLEFSTGLLNSLQIFTMAAEQLHYEYKINLLNHPTHFP